MVRLGQHFMIDKKVLDKIVACGDLKAEDRVLEIGPGEGALTRLLAERCDVTAIEKDSAIAGSLAEKMPGIDIIASDALKVRWPPFDKCISNLPYLISKPFMLKLLQHDFKLAVIVLQREFAEKLAAKPGDKDYGVVSVYAQLCCEIELLDKIPKNAFKPQPKVESQIVRLRPKQKLDKGFLDFVTKLFQGRNKKLGEKRVNQLTPEELLSMYTENHTEKKKPAEIIDIRGADLSEMAKRIKSGAVFIYPTDTVYGIGCDALNEGAVKRVFEIKGRVFDKPLSVAFGDIMQLLKFVSVDEDQKKELREKLPGPYTFIVKNKGVPKLVTAGRDTVGVRIPDYSLLLALIREVGGPIVTTSANLSGQGPARSVFELPPEILREVDFVLDGGRCELGRPSTVINLTSGERLR